MILPGATLGVLGGGQLGRMFTLAAHSMGYKVWVLDPDPDSPTGSMADRHLQAAYNDTAALDEMASGCAAVTTEFENVPAETLEFLEARIPVRPGSKAVAIARDRIREKSFIRDLGLPTADFFAINSAADLEQACAGLTMPALLKTAQFGYDGKGQIGVNDLAQARLAFDDLNEAPCVLEECVQLEQELSVILARGTDGQTAVYPPGENLHVKGILDTTCVPGRFDDDVAASARYMALKLANAMDYRGVLAVEFFITTDGRLLINEMAPRPHNSGHYTIDACLTSQFEQQVRTVCGLPPGSTRLLSAAVMVNVLGDLWSKGPPRWQHLFAETHTNLHLYGKEEARPGRKMGHFTSLADDPTEAMRIAERVRVAIDPAAPDEA
ncbi:5-(carboxyamino)imidazole ribonucleotide synthase [Thiogranum longum]|uniref:N5-carboxyaminoimidazole ribonucleotide synthase n=1 Tax=Thiogranum longum TaxID=1537524 RepID=A0A4R1HDC3_9GAMM|nr:5-(carboxyamino)imidazole ribonucleotide synthase [Thiogranum longum]TCK19518.1 5-(carboxyamino)imidazole ribonucleotide synthase [Thiogranum longum]